MIRIRMRSLDENQGDYFSCEVNVLTNFTEADPFAPGSYIRTKGPAAGDSPTTTVPDELPRST